MEMICKICKEEKHFFNMSAQYRELCCQCIRENGLEKCIEIVEKEKKE